MSKMFDVRAWLRGLKGSFCKDPAKDQELLDLKKQVSELNLNIDTQKALINAMIEEGNIATGTIAQLRKEIAAFYMANDTTLGKFCKKNYKQIPNIAYEEKRKIQGVSYNIFINELITPDAWEVKNLIRNVTFDPLDMMDVAEKIGARVSHVIPWDADANLGTSITDYYLEPNETIARLKGDCEDHTFVVCSCHCEFGGAWGFYLDSTGKLYGHAFNVFVYKDELYVLDTSPNPPKIIKYEEDKCGYRIHYIITKGYTFQVKPGIQFGTLAEWHEN